MDPVSPRAIKRALPLYISCRNELSLLEYINTKKAINIFPICILYIRSKGRI